jgi:hypothetical protein
MSVTVNVFEMVRRKQLNITKHVKEIFPNLYTAFILLIEFRLFDPPIISDHLELF